MIKSTDLDNQMVTQESLTTPHLPALEKRDVPDNEDREMPPPAVAPIVGPTPPETETHHDQ
jgi:hypothetical protein